MRALSEIPRRDPALLRGAAERFVRRRPTSHWQLNRDGQLVLRWYLDELEQEHRSPSPRG
jgi:hypothetical protein